MEIVKNHCSTDSEYITFRQAWEIVDLPLYYLLGDSKVRIDHKNITDLSDRLVRKISYDFNLTSYLITEWEDYSNE